MMAKFTAPNVVAMVLFIPLLIGLGLILAFVVPVLAIIVAVAGMLFTVFYAYTRVGMGRERQREAKKGEIEVKDYKIR